MTGPGSRTGRRDGLSESRRRLLEQRLRGRDRPPKRLRRNPADPVPATSMQNAMWAFAQSHPGSPAYHMHCALRLQGPLDLAALESALNAVVRRHEALRTVFTLEDRVLVQRVLPQLSIRLQVTPGGANVEQQVTSEITRPFDLSRGPLLRWTLFQEAPGRHLLLLVVHHIVADEWSLELLWKEVGALYRGGAPLPDVALQFPDHALERQARDAERVEARRRFWMAHLDGVDRRLNLPLDRPRPAVQTYSGAFRREGVDPALMTALQEIAQRHDATPFMVLFTAFAVLLSRLSGQRDFIVGVPTANRSSKRTESVVGMLIASLPVPCKIDPGASFVDCLDATRRAFLDGLTHVGVALEDLVSALEPKRDPARNPLFQTMFVMESDPLAGLELPGVTAERVELDAGAAKFELTLFANTGPAEPSLALEYNTDLFEPATARSFLRSYIRLIEQVAADPSTATGRLDLVSASESRRLLKELASGPDLPHPLEPLPSRILRVAEATPDAAAVTCGDRRLSYRQLAGDARDLAFALAAADVRPGDRVAIHLERSVEQVTAILGVLLAGASYVPLDPAYPIQRRRYVLDDLDKAGGRPPAVVTRNGSEDELGDPVRVVPIGGSQRAPVDWTPALPSLSAEAYVIYTSGSTGRPKGVVVSHANLAASTEARLQYYDRPATYLLVPSFAFDSSIAGIFWVLASGSSLVIPQPDESRDPLALTRRIRESGVTQTLMLPSLWRFVLDCAKPDDLASLVAVIVAGEACSDELVLAHGRALPEVELFNEYGPTEATVWTTVHRCTPEHNTPVPIGRPIAGARVYVLDDNLRPLPVGVPGELYIGGAGVARGYLLRPEETAQRFRPDPFVPGATLYRTGDRTRFRQDGALEFLGRADDQLKVRGYRIEPGEVASRIRSHPGVREAAVALAPRSGVASDASLVAFYESDEPSGVDAGELRDLLRQDLPEYMVPSAFVRLQELPRLANGKVDKRRLGTVGRLSRPPDERLPEPPMSAVEAELAGIWQHALGVERVRPDDDFFDLGGHSLLGVRLLLDVKERFGIEIPLADVFVAPTLREMATRLQGPESQQRVVAPIRGRGSLPPLFCVHEGGRLFADVMGPEQPVYLVFDNISTSSADMNSVESIAGHYMKDLRDVQPHGPYYLLGYSFGGMVAYEMALQLKAAGESVAALGLMDPPPDTGIRRMQVYRKLFRLRRAAGFTGKLRFLASEISLLVNRFLPRKNTHDPAAPPDPPNPEDVIRVKNIDRYAEVGATYTYPRSDLPCVVFLQEGHPAWMRYATRRWERLIDGPVAVEFVAGAHAHMDMVRPPHNRSIASRFAEVIRSAQGRDGEPR